MSNYKISEIDSVDKIAFAMALALAAKKNSIETPEQLMSEIETIYPECFEVAKKQRQKESIQPHSFSMKTTF